MSRRQYKGNSVPTSLAAPVGTSDTSATLTDGSSFPDGSVGPFVLTVDSGLTGEEKWLVTARSGNNLSGITRAYDGTTAATHSAGVANSVKHTLSAVDLDEANAHVNDTGDPHPQYMSEALGTNNGLFLGLVNPHKATAFNAPGNLVTHFTRFRPVATVTITALRFAIGGGTVAGNMDVGIYSDSAGAPNARLVSSGSFAVPAAGTTTKAISSTTLNAGTDYWLAWVMDSATATAAIGNVLPNDCARLGTAATIPLPATAVTNIALSSASQTQMPMLYIQT